MSAPAVNDPNTATAAVVIENLARTFGDRQVLQSINLRVQPGEFVALIGRSGSGKSTLLRALAGLDDATSGTIEVPERRSVGFQDPRLLPWLTVIDNVTLGLDGPDAVERGRQALLEVGLADHADDWPITLSGGEAQRVALARSLVRDPQLLLLDEPFGALDALTRLRMHDLLRALCALHHPAVVFVTHDVDEAIALADRIVVLSDGALSLNLPLELGPNRAPTDPGVAPIRARLLAELGVHGNAASLPTDPSASNTQLTPEQKELS